MSRRQGVMLAHPFEARRMEKWDVNYFVQPKLKGNRCVAQIEAMPYCDTIVCTLLSSEGNEFVGVPHINKSLTTMFEGIRNLMSVDTAIELDGELYTHGLSQQDIRSICGRSKNIHAEHEKLHYQIFDIKGDMAQARRIEMIRILEKYIPVDAPIGIVPTWSCDSVDGYKSYLIDCMDFGFEGIILRNYSSPYVEKRTFNMMKIKPTEEDVYIIVGINQEMDKDGYPKESLGSFRCRTEDDEAFNVGSGMILTKEGRRKYWESKGDLIGKHLRVKYECLTPDRQVPECPIVLEVV